MYNVPIASVNFLNATAHILASSGTDLMSNEELLLKRFCCTKVSPVPS